MIDESDLAKEIEKMAFTKPPFKVVDQAKDAVISKTETMLKQMKEIISNLDRDRNTLIDQRVKINAKIVDLTAAIVASEAAAEVLALVDNSKVT